jgi:hypothetical protein
VAFIWFRAQKDTAPHNVNQVLICVIHDFNYHPISGAVIMPLSTT